MKTRWKKRGSEVSEFVEFQQGHVSLNRFADYMDVDVSGRNHRK